MNLKKIMLIFVLMTLLLSGCANNTSDTGRAGVSGEDNEIGTDTVSGDDITASEEDENKSLMDMYEGELPELFEPDCDAYFIIEDAFELIDEQVQVVVVGRVNKGDLKVGDTVSILNNQGEYKFDDVIYGLENQNGMVDTAVEGDVVGIALEKHKKSDFTFMDYLIVGLNQTE